jgi:TonB family protein
MHNKIKTTLAVLLISFNFGYAHVIDFLVEKYSGSSVEDTIKTGKKVKASYPGGEKEMFKFIGENLKYPQKSRENYVEGRVIVEFTVSTEGEIIEPNILIGLDQFCDKEVLRIVNAMPNWIPASLNGTPTASKIKLPISFKAEKPFRKNDYYLDSKSISENEFNKLKPNKIKTLVIQREEFLTKMNVYTFKMLKTAFFEIQNISYVENTVSFDIISLPENGIIKTEVIDGNGKPIATKMILEPKSINDLKLSFPSTAKKPIFLGINQLGTTINVSLTD